MVFVSWNGNKDINGIYYGNNRPVVLKTFLWYIRNIVILDIMMILIIAFNNRLMHVIIL